MGLGLGSTEGAEPLVRAAPNERLETETNRLGVRLNARRGPSLAQEALVDVKRLFHTSDYAI